MTAPRAAMSPLDAEPRCRHDMLIIGGRHTCAWCLRLPDLPDLDPARVAEHAPRLLYIPSERHGECAACGARIRPGDLAAYSRVYDGPVCADCEHAA